jgi:hypothetical protein
LRTLLKRITCLLLHQSSQHSSIVAKNNIGTIYTIIEELVAEQEHGLKFNPLVDPTKRDRDTLGGGVSFSMNCSVFTGQNSDIFSTATPFCIFKDDTSVLTCVSKAMPNPWNGRSAKLRFSARPEESLRMASSTDLWSVNWTEMMDDDDVTDGDSHGRGSAIAAEIPNAPQAPPKRLRREERAMGEGA